MYITVGLITHIPCQKYHSYHSGYNKALLGFRIIIYCSYYESYHQRWKSGIVMRELSTNSPQHKLLLNYYNFEMCMELVYIQTLVSIHKVSNCQDHTHCQEMSSRYEVNKKLHKSNISRYGESTHTHTSSIYFSEWHAHHTYIGAC